MLHDSLHRLINLFEHKRRYQHETSGLKPGAMHALEWIVKNGSIKTLDLGKHCGIAPASLIDLLDKLEKNNLIIRTRSKEDKRVVMVSATEKAAGLVELHKKEDRLFRLNIMKNLSVAEQKTFAAILDKMLCAIDMNGLFKE